MPRDFPDMDSLNHVAKVHGFRQSNEGENERQYRTALADHVAAIDFVESCEIRNKVGWDKFTDKQNTAMLERKMGSGVLFDMLTKLDPRPKDSIH